MNKTHERVLVRRLLTREIEEAQQFLRSEQFVLDRIVTPTAEPGEPLRASEARIAAANIPVTVSPAPKTGSRKTSYERPNRPART
jgi:hypothetical protein